MSTINFVNTTPEEFAKFLSQSEYFLQSISKTVMAVMEKQSKGSSGDEYLTTNETLKILKVKAPTLWTYVKDGKIAKYTFEGRVFYKREELMNRFTKAV